MTEKQKINLTLKNIYGLSNAKDVLIAIKENIENNSKDTAIDMLNQVIDKINETELKDQVSDMIESRTLLAEKEDLMAEALNPLGKYKLVEGK